MTDSDVSLIKINIFIFEETFHTIILILSCRLTKSISLNLDSMYREKNAYKIVSCLQGVSM